MKLRVEAGSLNYLSLITGFVISTFELMLRAAENDIAGTIIVFYGGMFSINITLFNVQSSIW